MDVDKMMKNKETIVSGLTGGIEFLCKKYAHIPRSFYLICTVLALVRNSHIYIHVCIKMKIMHIGMVWNM